MNKSKIILKLLISIMPIVIIILLVCKHISEIEINNFENKMLIINEVMCDNILTLQNEKGLYSDWIEIYNTTSNEIDLDNFYLSDDEHDLFKWQFPAITIKPKEYLIVFCDNDLDETNKYIHTNFMLNSEKEEIFLSDKKGNIVDFLSLENQKTNISYGRVYGNTNKIGYLPYSSSGYANPTSLLLNEKTDIDWGKVSFSHEGGVYDNIIELELEYEDDNSVIFYTLDGSEPDINSYIYENAIIISNESRANKYTNKKCISSIDNSEVEYGVNEVYKGTVVRARVLKNGVFSSSIQTNSYFINADYKIPIVSLSTNPNDLFDDKEGNYVLGNLYYTKRKYSLDNINLINNMIPKVMNGYIEVYDQNNCLLKDDISFSIAGFSSAITNIQKSFNVSLNNVKAEGSIFGASNKYRYSEFSLRGPGGSVSQNDTYAYLNSFAMNYLKRFDIGAQSNSLCILFIDGEYWGIYNLMEPKGKEYIEQHYKTDKKNIEIVIPYEYKTTKEFDELFQLILEKDFVDAKDYQWIKTKIDIENYMQFLFAQLYFSNTDGLLSGDHNFYIWKEKNGLWKWQIFDMDSSMVYGEDCLNRVLNFEIKGEEEKNFSIWLFQKLWNSKYFRNEFYHVVKNNCQNDFTDNKVIDEFIGHIKKIYFGGMEENLLRCNKDYNDLMKISYKLRNIDAEYDNYDMCDWEDTVKDRIMFFENRSENLLKYIKVAIKNKKM